MESNKTFTSYKQNLLQGACLVWQSFSYTSKKTSTLAPEIYHHFCSVSLLVPLYEPYSGGKAGKGEYI